MATKLYSYHHKLRWSRPFLYQYASFIYLCKSKRISEYSGIDSAAMWLNQSLPNDRLSAVSAVVTKRL